MGILEVIVTDWNVHSFSSVGHKIVTFVLIGLKER